MLNIQQLSFWEKQTYFESIDFTIIGAGIVGLSTAYHLRKLHPKAKIVILEKGYLPSGASTKNAGFACFGSPSELLSDLKNNQETTWETVNKRYTGLIYLQELLGDTFDFQQNGSWEIMEKTQATLIQEIDDFLPELNTQLFKITKQNHVYSKDDSAIAQFGFQNLETTYNNRLEGQINTGLMMKKFENITSNLGISILYSIDVQSFDETNNEVQLQTNIGAIKTNHLLICTNGFAKKIISSLDVKPARAQVIVTSPIENLKLKGTFHYDEGYYYFRNINQRILLGGGRNLDFEGETTDEMVTTTPIISKLNSILKEIIIPNTNFNIDYQWSGIMGVGENKQPIIEKISPKVAVGVKMGGMGVAIGSVVGRELAELFH